MVERSSTTNSVRFAHPVRIASPTVVIVAGTRKFVNPVQFSKHLSPMVVREDGRSTNFNEEQPENVPFERDNRLFPNTML